MQPGTYDPKEGVIILHNDEQGFVGIAAENTGSPRTLSDYFTVALGVTVMVGMCYWLHDILTRDISLLPAVRNLSEDHPLKIALAEENAQKALLQQEGEKVLSQAGGEGRGEAVATSQSVVNRVALPAPEEAGSNRAHEVVETVTVPLPQADPDGASAVKSAIMTALQTEYEVAPDAPGVKISLRPRRRP